MIVFAIVKGFLGKLGPKTAAVIGAVIAVGVLLWIIDSRAYNRGFLEAERQWQERLKTELARQDAVNEQALADALLKIEEIQQVKEESDDFISGIIDEADVDVGASSCGVGADSVRRLNSILNRSPAP